MKLAGPVDIFQWLVILPQTRLTPSLYIGIMFCGAVHIYSSFQSLNYFNYDIGEGQGGLKILIYLMVEYIFTGFVYT